MRKTKPARRKVDKKSARRKKANIKNKPLQRRKPSDSTARSRSRSAQIHQGVGPMTGNAKAIPEIPDDAAE